MRATRIICKVCMTVYLFLFACKKDRAKDSIMRLVSEWKGKEILFSEGIPCQFLCKDTVCVNPNNPTAYKILLYVDSSGCTNCRLKLAEWKQLISEADVLFPCKIDFLVFCQPKQRDVKELAFLLRQNDFQYPVFLDIYNQIDRVNRFPADPSFQRFFLDKDNKVVLIGNPAANQQIWELYNEQISGIKRTANPFATVQVNPVRKELVGMKMGETYSCVFEIENTGDNSFVIMRILSSCGCSIPTWDKQPIRPREKTKIKVEVKPESSGFFNKTIDVYGNIEQSVIKSSIIGTVE